MPVTIVGNNTPTAGGVVYGDGTNYASTAAGTSGQILVSAGSGAPTWTGNVTLSANSSAPYYTGGSYTWTITNYDSATTYTVSTTNGTVSQTNNLVTYNPSTAGAGGFIINGRTISVTITAFPAISAGTPAVFLNSAQIAGILSVAKLTSTTVAILYCDFTNNGLYAVVASISGTTVTYGSAVLVRSNYSPQIASICALSSTLCLVGYETVASNHFGAKTLSISGTTITVNAEVTNGIVSTNIVMCPLTATTALAMYSSSLVVVSVAGTVPSFGTPVSTGLPANYKSISQLSSTKAIILYDGTSAYPTANVVSVSGTTVTIGSGLVIQSVGTGQLTSVIALSATTAIAQMTGAANVVQVAPLTISGTSVTTGSVSSLSAATVSSSPQAAAYIDATSAVALYTNATGAGVGVVNIYNASTLATGSVTTLVAGTTIGRMTGVYLDTNKVFCVYNTGTTSASGLVITVS